jgi:hypothetical protein
MGVQTQLARCRAPGVSANTLISAISNMKEAAIQIKRQAKVHLPLPCFHVIFEVTWYLCAHSVTLNFCILCLQTLFPPIHKTQPGLHTLKQLCQWG